MMMTNATDCNLDAFRTLYAERISNMSYPYEAHYFKKLDVDDYVKFFACIIIIIGGLIGNISVILTVALNRSMRTTINYFVANLAAADALICIFCMGTHSFRTLTVQDTFTLGAFMCKFSKFMQMVCLLSSVFTLSAISCDRFIAIMFPLHVRIAKQRPFIVMQIIWVISIVVSLPYLIFKTLTLNKRFMCLAPFWTDDIGDDKKTMTEIRRTPVVRDIFFRDFVMPVCREDWPKTVYYDEDRHDCIIIEHYRLTYYILSYNIALYFIPVIVMMTSNSLILWKLWTSEVPGERHAANINVQYRTRKKVIKMVLVVLIAFIICWTPIQILICIAALQRGIQISKWPWVLEYEWVSYYLAFSNSFINPIIYGGFNKTFRDGFCIMLRCGYRRDRFSRNRGNHDPGAANDYPGAANDYPGAANDDPGAENDSTRSRLTFTTGVTSSPSGSTSKTINGTNKNSSLKSDNREMVPVYHPNGDGDTSENMKYTCVGIADGKQLL